MAPAAAGQASALPPDTAHDVCASAPVPVRRSRQIDWTLRTYEVTAIAFAAITVALVRRTHLPFSTELAVDLLGKTLAIIAAVYVAAAIVCGVRALRHIRRHGRAHLRDPRIVARLTGAYRSLDFLVLTVRRAVAVFTGVFFFLHLKHVILWTHFANYDRTLWDLDRWLHFGVQPNVWALATLGGNAEWEILIDWLYIKYFDYKMLVALIFLCELRGRALSERFFLAYTLLWAVGGLAYLILPSDGPCYAMLLQHTTVPELAHQWGFPYPIATDVPASYAQAYVKAQFWTAKELQHVLWVQRWNFVYGNRVPGIFYGIAAMPSLHVAAVVMLAVFLWRLSGWAGLLGAGYALLIMVGSVFLQWHYAVDAYVGAAMALAMCWLALRVPPDVFARRNPVQSARS